MANSEVAKILIDAHRLGVKLFAEGENLRYRGPIEVVSEELLMQFTNYKSELLSLVQKTDPLHYALSIIGNDNVLLDEPCLARCGKLVKFYWRNGTGYGYCTRCGRHQLIETRVV
jgi:hypothetical protein